MLLAYVDQDRGKVDPGSFETITLAREVAGGDTLEALVVGEPAAGVVEKLGEFGVSTLHVVQHSALTEYAPDAYAAALAGVVAAGTPRAVLAAGSERGNEILAHLAARLDVPFAANCTEIHPNGGFTVTRLRWGGSLLEEARVTGSPALLSVAPNTLAAAPAPAPVTTNVVPVIPQLSDADLLVRVVGREETAADKVSLAEARVVVGGGRGVGSAEGFRSLEALAELLGGAVGGSRAVTSLGWRAHADQIGQTGTRIAPEIYITCGVSGAIQHMIGCKAAKHILAINTDPDAPVMARADYVVIGDLHQVVPAITAEIKKRKGGK